MPPVGFEPAIPAREWPQTHALDRVAAGMGCENSTWVLLTVSKAQLPSLPHWHLSLSGKFAHCVSQRRRNNLIDKVLIIRPNTTIQI